MPRKCTLKGHDPELLRIWGGFYVEFLSCMGLGLSFVRVPVCSHCMMLER